jgi:hypothetical protein
MGHTQVGIDRTDLRLVDIVGTQKNVLQRTGSAGIVKVREPCSRKIEQKVRLALQTPFLPSRYAPALVLSWLALSLFLVLSASGSPATDGDDDAAVDDDGDGVLVGDDCDDADPDSTIVADDLDCDGDLDVTDCAPDDPLIYTGAPETLSDGLD